MCGVDLYIFVKMMCVIFNVKDFDLSEVIMGK